MPESQLTYLVNGGLAASSFIHQSNCLAEQLNTWLGNIAWGSDVLSTHYAVIFNKLPSTSYDVLANNLLSNKNWREIVRLKRTCEVSNYSGSIDSALTEALLNFPMNGSLPITYGQFFLVYHRYMMQAYRYAEVLNMTAKWNKTAAFLQLASVTGGQGSLMVGDQAPEYTDQAHARYYDEEAETLSCYLKLYQNGVNEAEEYCDLLWNHINTWHDPIYGNGWWVTENEWIPEQGWYMYAPRKLDLECEMGGFSLIISEYLGYVHPNILSDLDTKLLKNGWNSYCWLDGVVTHSYSLVYHDRNEQRPWETCAVWRTLQTLYPNLTDEIQLNVQNLLLTPAWQYVPQNAIYNQSNLNRLAGAMVMFLNGIVPSSGCLDLDVREEEYCGNCIDFPSNQLAFDYENKRIRIPVKEGELTFLFGSQIVSHNFTSGVWDIYFTDDWDSVWAVEEANDRVVDILDAIEVSNTFNTASTRTDYNKDGIVDILDAIKISDCFGRRRIFLSKVTA